MPGRRTKLTPTVHQQIVGYIRGGVFPLVAAVAARVGKSTFYDWMARGERETSGIYHDFVEEVRQAGAQARAAAEAEVRRANPLAWLRYGPGRERPGEPGWTNSSAITGADGGPMRITFDINTLNERNEEDSNG